MSKVRFIGLFAAAALFCLPTVARAEDLAEDLPIKLIGDSVEYFYEQKRAVASGNVMIDYQESVLTADHIEVNLETKEAKANGNVTLEQDGALYTGETVFINFETKSAEIVDMTATVAPHYHAKGSRVRKINDEYYIIDDSFITTCDKESCEDGRTPAYRIQSKDPYRGAHAYGCQNESRAYAQRHRQNHQNENGLRNSPNNLP